MKSLILVFALASLAVNAQDTSSTVNGPLNITPAVEFLVDPDGLLTIEQVSSPAFKDRFTHTGSPHLSFGFNENYYWLKFNVDVNHNDSLVLELEHAFIPYAELFSQLPDGSWTSTPSGYKIPILEKGVKDHFQSFLLSHNTKVFYIRLMPYLHPVTLNVWEKNAYQVHVSKRQIIYGVYAGMLLFAILINLFLFTTLRKFYYLLYALLVTLYLGAAAGVMEGYMIYFFPDADMMFWYKIIPVLNMPALMFYCLSFLEVRKFSRVAFQLTLASAILIICYITALIFLPLLPYLLINQLLALVVFIMVIWVGVLVGRKGNRLGYYFAITYSIWFVLLCFEEIYIHYGIPPHIFFLSYVSVAIFTEAFMLAYLQVKRFEWERTADENMRLDMQRNMAEIQVRFQSEIMRAQLEMQEQTLQSVSQEIHDNIGQTLSLVKINLNLAQTKNPKSEERLADSIDLLSKAIHELRDLTRTMNTDYIHEIGLPAAIDEQVRLLRKTGTYKIEFNVRGRVQPLRSQHELLIFRIAQELINNTIKHANASTVRINMQYGTETLVIEFEDDGCGFDINEVNERASKGLGLNHMLRRAELVGGSLQVISRPLNGSHFIITIPYEQQFVE